MELYSLNYFQAAAGLLSALDDAKVFLSQGWPCKKPTNQPKKLWSLLTSLCDSRSWPTAAVLKLLFHEWLWSPLQKAFLLNITEYGVVMWPQMSCFQNWRRNSLAQIWFNPRDRVCSRDLQALNSRQGQWLWLLTRIIFSIYLLLFQTISLYFWQFAHEGTCVKRVLPHNFAYS